VRVGRRPEDDILFRHRRRIQPHQGFFVLELYELLEQVLQYLPLILPFFRLFDLDS